MAKQAKAKTNKGEKNPDRKNGKANKKKPGLPRPHKERPTDLHKVLMGQGMYQAWPVVGNGVRSRQAISDQDSDD